MQALRDGEMPRPFEDARLDQASNIEGLESSLPDAVELQSSGSQLSADPAMSHEVEGEDDAALSTDSQAVQSSGLDHELRERPSELNQAQSVLDGEESSEIVDILVPPTRVDSADSVTGVLPLDDIPGVETSVTEPIRQLSPTDSSSSPESNREDPPSSEVAATPANALTREQSSAIQVPEPSEADPFKTESELLQNSGDEQQERQASPEADSASPQVAPTFKAESQNVADGIGPDDVGSVRSNPLLDQTTALPASQLSDEQEPISDSKPRGTIAKEQSSTIGQ